jgi:hypothetical protein
MLGVATRLLESPLAAKSVPLEVFMQPFFKTAASFLLAGAVSILSPVASLGQTGSAPVQVRQVQVLGNPKLVEIEVQTSDQSVPQTQVLTNPDRLVVDFPNAVPRAGLHNQAVNRGEVKGIRVSQFSAKPPITRLVVDLNGPQPYQVFPNGRSVIVKVGAGSGTEVAGAKPAVANHAVVTQAVATPVAATPAAAKAVSSAASKPVAKLAPAVSSGLAAPHSTHLSLKTANYPAQPVQIPAPAPAAAPAPPPLQVSFKAGMLSISSHRSSLSEILLAVQQRTGADIAIPTGAEQEQVAAELGPAPAPEVLAHLLNGSKFNFLIVSSPADPAVLDRVILSQRSTLLMPLPQAPTQIRPATPPEEEPPPPTEPEAMPQPPPQPPQETPNPTQPPPTPPDR